MTKELPWIILLSALFVLLALPVFAKKASKKPDGAVLFAQHCASCHQGGGNLVKPKKSIVGSKHLDNILSFKTYLQTPPGHMPYYQHIVNNKEQLNALYDYCKRTYKDKALKQS